MAKNQLPSLTPEITEAFAPQVLEVIRTSIAPTANDQEFLLFAHKAASYGLDPFKNEIFFIKYGNTARIQFAAEAYLSKAREKEGFQPPDTQMVHENDEFKIAMNKETKEMEVAIHEIGFPRGPIIGAYSIAYRDGHRPVTVIMDIDEVKHMFTGQNKDNWNKWTSDMFGKHVQQRALKKQYGLDFDDVTLNQEQGGSNIPEYKPDRKDITPSDKKEPKAKTDTEESHKNAVRSAINEAFGKLGITTKEGTSEYIKTHMSDFNKDSLSDLNSLLKLLEMNIEVNEMNADDEEDL